jgi:tetratricopeptide (TPR) repeat protein
MEWCVMSLLVCPSVPELQAYLAGELPAELQTQLQTHTSACAHCQRHLESFAPNGDRETAATMAAPAENEAGEQVNGRGPALRGLPAQIGPYQILGRVGRGGNGDVFAAFDPRLHRRVALKLLRPDRASPDGLARLQREAEALAGLTHPHIVGIYEIGEHADNAYLALEYVAGGTLARWAAGRPIAPADVICLVAPIADAVHCAHQAGIVHRDLKPANILLQVPGTDAAAQAGAVVHPKVADFGLARRQVEEWSLTPTGAAIGTPAYMAPEQAAGQPVGPAADIYSVGAILYELLTGRAPFQADTITRTLYMVLHHEPIAPRHLQPGVSHDLETVCLKCLEKEPWRRYRTAAELAADLRRLQVGESIMARPVSHFGRAWRWARRNRAVASLALVAGLLLLGGIAGISVFALRAAEERDRATVLAQTARTAEVAALADKQRADENANETAAINAFLFGDLLLQASPEAQANAQFEPIPTLTVRAALDRAAAKVAARFADNPAIAERVRDVLGRAYGGVGQFADAAAQFQLAYTSRQQRLGPDHPDTLEMLHQLGMARRDEGRPADAVGLLTECLRLRTLHLGPDHLDTFTTINALGTAYRGAERAGDAITLYQEHLPRMRAQLGQLHPVPLSTLAHLANAYIATDQATQAILLHQESMAGYQQKLGSEHPLTLTALGNLGVAYRKARRFADALKLYEELLPRLRAKLGPDHPTTLVATTNLGSTYFVLNRPQDSARVYQECLLRLRDKLGHDHPQTLAASTNLIQIYDTVGQTDSVIRLGEECLPHLKRKLGPIHPHTLTVLLELTKSYFVVGRAADAIPLLEECLPLCRQKYGQNDLPLVRLQQALIDAYRSSDRYADAVPLLELAWQSWAAAPPNSPGESVARLELGECLLLAGRTAEAQPHLLAAQAGLAQSPTRTHALRACCRALAELYERRNQPAEAARWLARAYEGAEPLPSPRSAP